MLRITVLTLSFLIIYFCSIHSCTMLGIIRIAEPDTTGAEDLELLFNSLRQTGSQNPDGWGATYYSGSLFTSNGFIWTYDPDQHICPDSGDLELGYHYNRFSDWRPVTSATGGYNYEQARDEVILSNPDVILAHLRSATTGATAIPNPHPFVVNSSERSYTFSHNGTITPGLLVEMADYMDILYTENIVDSQLYFSFLLHMINEQEGDVLLGLNAALVFMSHVHCGKTFLFSDGEDIYAYRKTTPPNYVRHRLHYSTNFSEYYTPIMTTPVGLHGSWEQLGLNEMAVLSSDGSVSIYSDFDAELMDSDGNDDFLASGTLCSTDFPVAMSIEKVVYESNYVSLYIKNANIFEIEAEVYNLKGQKIQRLPNATGSGNIVRLSWLYDTKRGSRVSSGVYFLHVRSHSYELVRKITVIF